MSIRDAERVADGELNATLAEDLDEELPNEFSPKRKGLTMADYFNAKAQLTQNVQAVKDTPVTRLSAAVERLLKAEGYVSEVASKLCGQDSSLEANAKTDRLPGVLGDIDGLSDDVASIASRIIEHVQRIQARL